MTTPDPAIAGDFETLSLPDPAPERAAGIAGTLETLAAQAAGVPSAELIARLANQFFQALPGQPSANPEALPPLDVTTAPAQGYAPSHTAVQSTPQATVLAPASRPLAAVPPTGHAPRSAGSWDGTLDLQSIPHALSSLLTFARPVPADAPAFPGRAPAPVDPVPAAAPPHPSLPGARSRANPPELPTSQSYFAHEAVSAASSEETPFRFDVLRLPPESVVYNPGHLPAIEQKPRPFDPYAIRRDFPILQERVHGKPLIWLDNGATTQKPRSVIDRVSSFYEHENSNVHRGAHTLAARATDAYETAREKVRSFLNAASALEIIFVRGTTEGINLVAQSWGRQNIQEGDEIVVTHLEHHANIVPWQQLIAEKGARLRVAPVDDDGQVILEAYEQLLNSRTKLVAITAVSNALGTITPAHAMSALAHRHGTRVLIDGAQAVSHMPVDVQSLDADFYVFSGHKVFGPTGIGVVYGKKEVLDATPPWQGGGNMIADVTFERTVFQPAPFRFEAGTGNIADAVGLGAALDYVTAIGMPVIAAYEHGLLEYATSGLRTVPGLRLFGTAKEKAGVLSFVLDGIDPVAVGNALDREGIAVRAGHHCAQPILRRFGVEGTVRASLAPYNTCEDIDALVATLHRIARR